MRNPGGVKSAPLLHSHTLRDGVSKFGAGGLSALKFLIGEMAGIIGSGMQGIPAQIMGTECPIQAEWLNDKLKKVEHLPCRFSSLLKPRKGPRITAMALHLVLFSVFARCA